MGAAGALRKKIQKRNAPEPGGAADLALKMADPETQGEADPAKMKQLETVTAMCMRLIHGKETRNSTLEILKADEPERAIPNAALTTMQRVETQAKKRHQRIPNDIKFAAAQYLVADLTKLGNKAGAWGREVSQEELGPILQSTMQTYIQRGLKDKSIDPIKLQAEIEPLMPEEMKEKAMQYRQEFGLPERPTATMAAERYKEDAVSKERQKNAELQQRMQAMQQQQQSALAGPDQQVEG